MAARDPFEVVLFQALADCQAAKADLATRIASLQTEVALLRDQATKQTARIADLEAAAAEPTPEGG